MGTAFHVDPAALKSAAQLLDGFEQAAENFIATVDRKVDDLHVDWEGEAATAHRRAQQHWRVGAQEMRTAVGQLRSILNGAHGNYTSAAAVNTAMWQRSP